MRCLLVLASLLLTITYHHIVAAPKYNAAQHYCRVHVVLYPRIKESAWALLRGQNSNRTDRYPKPASALHSVPNCLERHAIRESAEISCGIS